MDTSLQPDHDGVRRVAILGYHKIGPPPPDGWETWFYLPEAAFSAQLTYLKAHGWAILSLQSFLAGLMEPETLPARSALITFDDGYRSLLHCAIPHLERFDCPAVVFVPTDFVGGFNSFDSGAEPCEPICDWDELRALEHHRVAVQSHAVTHRALGTLTVAERESEVLLSKGILEEKLQRPVELFSFPFGDAAQGWGSMGALLHRAGYRGACLYGGGAFDMPPSDPYLLSRVAMGVDTDLRIALGP